MKQKILPSLITLTAVMGITACFNKPAADALSQVKKLRDPSNLNHTYLNSEIRSEEFLAFQGKMRDFSARISESFATREFSENENIVISPISIELCLGLAIASANGNTRQEMLDAIGVDFETFSKYYKLFYNQTLFETFSNTNQSKGKLLLSNSIWIDNDVALKDSGLDDLQDNYYCYSYDVDFDKQNKKSNEAIRQFVKEQTKGLIDQNFNIDPATLFVLMNTLYIKDVWNDAGADLSYVSTDYKFKNYSGSISKKKLLRGYYNDGRTLESEDFSSFYTTTDSGLSLHFIKPNEEKDIRHVFNKTNINTVLDGSNYVYRDDEKRELYHTRCIFPEYKADTDVSLNQMFSEDFNVKSLFNTSCDFSNLSDSQVFCSEFRHVAKLKVNKKGIEGAAVTHMSYAGAAAPDETWTDVYEEFVVDKEFGFVLSHHGDVLFSGIVTNID